MKMLTTSYVADFTSGRVVFYYDGDGIMLREAPRKFRTADKVAF